MPSNRRKKLDEQREAKKKAMAAPGFKSKYSLKRRGGYIPPVVDHRKKERHGEEFRLNPHLFMRTNKDSFGGWAS